MDLFALVARGDVDGLKAALAADPAAASAANADGASLLSWAAYMGKADAIAAIRAVRTELTPYEAVTLGDVAATKVALAAGWDANTLAPDGFTPISLACFFRRGELVDLLLPLTKDLNVRAKNRQQVAALHAAAASKDSASVEKLLRAGADPDLEQQDGFRPLHAAAQHGDAVMAGLLLLAGADPKLTNAKGESSADIARASGHDWLADRLSAL